MCYKMIRCWYLTKITMLCWPFVSVILESITITRSFLSVPEPVEKKRCHGCDGGWDWDTDSSQSSEDEFKEGSFVWKFQIINFRFLTISTISLMS